MHELIVEEMKGFVSTQRWDGLHAIKVYVDESQNVEQGSSG